MANKYKIKKRSTSPLIKQLVLLANNKNESYQKINRKKRKRSVRLKNLKSLLI